MPARANARRVSWDAFQRLLSGVEDRYSGRRWAARREMARAIAGFGALRDDRDDRDSRREAAERGRIEKCHMGKRAQKHDLTEAASAFVVLGVIAMRVLVGRRILVLRALAAIGMLTVLVRAAMLRVVLVCIARCVQDREQPVRRESEEDSEKSEITARAGHGWVKSGPGKKRVKCLCK